MTSDYERAMLCQAMHSPGLIDEYVLTETLFESADHRDIFKAIEAARNECPAVDLITVSDMAARAGRRDLTATIAGLEYASPGNAGFYAEQLRERLRLKNLKRSIIEGAEALKTRTSVEVADSLIASVMTSMQAVAEPDVPTLNNTLLDYSDMVACRVKERRDGKTKYVYLGVPALDAKCREIRGGEVIVIAARPGAGKTALALQSAIFSSWKTNLPVAYFSMEMLRYEILDRLIAQTRAATVSSIRGGYLSDAQVGAVKDAAAALYAVPMSIYDGSQTLSTLRSRIRREVAVNKVKAVYIDYLGLLDVGVGGKTPRWELIGETSRVLKNMALDMNLTMIEVVQLRRDAQDQEPTMADLRDSGTIEQDADRIILLYNRTKNDYDKSDAPRDVDAIVAKNRNGPIGKVSLKFDGPHVLFTDAQPVHEPPREEPKKITIGEKIDDHWAELGGGKSSKKQEATR